MNWWIPSKLRKAAAGTVEATQLPSPPPGVAPETWAAFAKGDSEAFAAIYRQHAGMVYHFLLASSASRETAEEVTQEVFVFLLREWRRYDAGRGTLEAWLLGIARQLLRRARQGRGFEELPDGPAGEPVSQGECVLDGMLHQERQNRLHQAVARLPEVYREALVLHALQGLSYEEVARQLDCALGTVRSRIARAKDLLIRDLHDTAPAHAPPGTVRGTRSANCGEKGGADARRNITAGT